MSGKRGAVFTRGSTWRHLWLMSLTNATGLMTIFLVDLVDIIFISHLGVTELSAGVGFAGSVLFFVRSIAIALGITTSVLVSRQLGRGAYRRAGRYALNTLLFAIVTMAFLITLMFFARDFALQLIGASGQTLIYASKYLMIVIPGTLFMVIGMCGGQIIRALGQARLSMWMSIAAALVNAILDPIFIFVCDWKLVGAAWATVASQMTLMLLTWYVIIFRFRLLAPFSWSKWREDARDIAHIALPAMITNSITPLSSAFAARQMATFGDNAVAAYAVIMRMVPVSLAIIFALSGAVAPIIGQNAGAGLFDRVRQTTFDALKFNWLVVAIVTLIIFLLAPFLPRWFALSGQAAEIIRFFCSGITILFGFNGMIFFLNAVFNNLNRPFYSTASNMARVLLGTIPLVSLGAYFFGAYGVIVGYMGEGVVVSIISWLIAQRLIEDYRCQKLKLPLGNALAPRRNK